ncbi:unnamed protein product, partial [Brassica oleracea var. botrytis]
CRLRLAGAFLSKAFWRSFVFTSLKLLTGLHLFREDVELSKTVGDHRKEERSSGSTRRRKRLKVLGPVNFPAKPAVLSSDPETSISTQGYTCRSCVKSFIIKNHVFSCNLIFVIGL